MLATPAEGADGAPARTKQRGSSAEAACDAERLRREHDVVYLRSWPSLQQGPPDKRPKLLSLPSLRCGASCTFIFSLQRHGRKKVGSLRSAIGLLAADVEAMGG